MTLTKEDYLSVHEHTARDLVTCDPRIRWINEHPGVRIECPDSQWHVWIYPFTDNPCHKGDTVEEAIDKAIAYETQA
jgi:hypothetical protein